MQIWKIIDFENGRKIINRTSMNAHFNADFRNLFSFKIINYVSKRYSHLSNLPSGFLIGKSKFAITFLKVIRFGFFTYLNSTNQCKSIDVWFVYFEVIFMSFTILTLFLWENRKFATFYNTKRLLTSSKGRWPPLWLIYLESQDHKHYKNCFFS